MAEEDFFDDDMTKYVNSFQLSELAINIVVYIAGWTVMRVKQHVKCDECTTALEDSSLIDSEFAKLLKIKMRGNLTVPSKDVITICLETEKQFRENAYNIESDSNPYNFDNPYKTLSQTNCHNVLCAVLVSCQKYQLLGHIKNHVKTHKGNMNHVVYLMRAIVEKYLKSRFHFAEKSYNISLKLAAKAKCRNQANTETKQSGQ